MIRLSVHISIIRFSPLLLPSRIHRGPSVVPLSIRRKTSAKLAHRCGKILRPAPSLLIHVLNLNRAPERRGAHTVLPCHLLFPDPPPPAAAAGVPSDG